MTYIKVKKIEIVMIAKPEKIPYVIDVFPINLWKNSGIKPKTTIKEKYKINTIKVSV